MKSKLFGWLLLIVVAVVVTGTGCCSETGAREFIPGKGWKPVD